MDIEKTISEMTLEEKTSLLSGSDAWHTQSVERLNLPSVMVADGPHGLRKQIGKTDNLGINKSIEAVCFPSAAGIAASFDRELIREMGDTLGRECRAEDVAILLGPAINIKRSPLCGRNFEYLSEDPYLAGELAAAYIEGVQKNDVGVSVKHYAANNQESRRQCVSAEIDKRTLHEIYLTAFEKAVKQANPWTLMCSYNRINGEFSSENKWLLTDVLRERWGFKGFVMSDWGAVRDRVKGVAAGLELEMPASGGLNDRKVRQAVEDGALPPSVVDTAAERLLNVVARYTDSKLEKPVFDREKDHKKAVEIALSTMVLLKNNGILPLNKDQKVVLIGEFAKTPRYQGGGSSHINPHKVVSAREALLTNTNVTYQRGYDTVLDKANEALEKEAVEAAKNADVAVVFLGLPDRYESEGYDRTDIDLPEYQNALLNRILSVQKNVAVVLHNGSPVAMPWIDEVSAVLESYLAGEGVGEAQAKLLYGEANPSGKLAETFPVSLSDVPSSQNFPGGQKTVEYREGLYVGYRYFQTVKKPVLFPFGHGLSYTQFEYSDLRIEGEFPFTVRFDVKNVGSVFGAEAAQLYVSAGKKTEYRPKSELKGFEKVSLAPGERKTVTIELGEEAFRAFDAEADDWYIEEGDYEILAGASSENILLSASVFVPKKGAQPHKKNLPHYESAEIAEVSDEEFETLLGRKLTPSFRDPEAPFDATDTFEDAKDSKWGKRILKLARTFIRGDETVNAEMIYRSFAELPINAFQNMTGGAINETAVEGILGLLNDKGFFRSVAKIIKGVCQKRK